MTDQQEKLSSTIAKEPKKLDEEHSFCNKRVGKTLKNERVIELLRGIENLGCRLPTPFISCQQCEGDVSGGFICNDRTEGRPYVPKIIMCENKDIRIDTFEQTLIHELVHAYDACNTKLDISNCAQHACTEVRAANLSGECGSILTEALRGHFRISGGAQECVKRRATLSVSMNPHCNKPGVAEKAVETAMKKCFEDRCPFDEFS